MTNTETTCSHPEESVRHSYPLAIEKAGVGQSFQLLMRTLPYAMVRLGILVGISLATIIWIGSTVGISAFLTARVHEIIGGAWFIGGFGIYGYVWYTIVRYFLFSPTIWPAETTIPGAPVKTDWSTTRRTPKKFLKPPLGSFCWRKC